MRIKLGLVYPAHPKMTRNPRSADDSVEAGSVELDGAVKRRSETILTPNFSSTPATWLEQFLFHNIFASGAENSRFFNAAAFEAESTHASTGCELTAAPL